MKRLRGRETERESERVKKTRRVITGSHGSLGRWETSDSACTARASISPWSPSVSRESTEKPGKSRREGYKTEKLIKYN